jgi:hypothetical protein
VYSDFRSDPNNINVNPGRNMPLVGQEDASPAYYLVSYVNSSGVNQGTAYYVKPADITGIIDAPSDCEDCPECPEMPDVGAIVEVAVKERDGDWAEALRAGQPWPSEGAGTPTEDE